MAQQHMTNLEVPFHYQTTEISLQLELLCMVEAIKDMFVSMTLVVLAKYSLEQILTAMPMANSLVEPSVSLQTGNE
ncbi:hypothetical protein RS9916_36827 [Synechococcus sp. RS9916]|nr:hypothetical protein RS9916_36827 [Synechococcus sp. RS9916]